MRNQNDSRVSKYFRIIDIIVKNITVVLDLQEFHSILIYVATLHDFLVIGKK